MLRDFFKIMEEYFMPRYEPIKNLLHGIVENPEMQIIALMMDEIDKSSKYNIRFVDILWFTFPLFAHVTILFEFSSLAFRKMVNYVRHISKKAEAADIIIQKFEEFFNA